MVFSISGYFGTSIGPPSIDLRQIIPYLRDIVLFNGGICHDNGRKHGVFLINEFWEMALLLLAYPPFGTEKVPPHVLHVLSYIV